MRYVDKTEKPSSSMDLGTLIHKAVLEPETFQDQYFVMPGRTDSNDLDSKQLEALCKEHSLKASGTKAEKLSRLREAGIDIEPQYEEIIGSISSDKIIVPPATIKKALAIKDKIYSHEKVGPWVSLSQKEKRGWFEIDGVIMRFQIDGFFEHNGIGVVWDLKTTKDWHSDRFSRSISKNGFHLQLACYREALRKIENKEFNAFMIIAVETSEPFRVRYYQIDEASLDAGRKELDIYLQDYKYRLQNNDFSPRKEDTKINLVSLTSWDWEKINSLESEWKNQPSF